MKKKYPKYNEVEIHKMAPTPFTVRLSWSDILKGLKLVINSYLIDNILEIKRISPWAFGVEFQKNHEHVGAMVLVHNSYDAEGKEIFFDIVIYDMTRDDSFLDKNLNKVSSDDIFNELKDWFPK
jgi:hypothetical protein